MMKEKFKHRKYLIPSAWTLCPEMNPLQNICSSELVLILWHVHTLTQTKIENSEPFTWSASARLKAGLSRPAQYDTAAAAAAAATAAAPEDQTRVTSVRLHRARHCGLSVEFAGCGCGAQHPRNPHRPGVSAHKADP